MLNRNFVIFYKGNLVIEITDLPEFYLPSDILDAYSKEYGFERHKLRYSIVDSIRYNELNIWKK